MGTQTPSSLQTLPLDIGGRRELFVDDFLIETCEGAELRLHSPTPREVVLVHDAPWEGTGCIYHTVFRDGDAFRMYYLASDLTSPDGACLSTRPRSACVAESEDGLHWSRPELGIVEFEGSARNNIVWTAPDLDNFSVYKDANPECRPGEEYKALTSGEGGLWALKSSDGLHWSPLAQRPVLTRGAFDTLNLAFWDPLRGRYWAYVRDFHDGLRDIRVATSEDYLTWSDPEPLRYVDSPDEQLYTNQVLPYYRAPHLLVGFPTRYVERDWSPTFEALPDPEHRRRRMEFSPRYGTAVTDGLFMSSRDGRTFRRWGEAFLRPGIERRHNWLYGDCYQNWGLIETAAEDPLAPPELSLYATENSWKTAVRLRRYTLRLDGFVSLHASLRGGTLVTRPLLFTGQRLSLNLSTSAAGCLRVELQDAEGRPLPGHTLAGCDELFGDSLDRVATWKGSPEVASLAGRPVRLRFELRDADLFALQFTG